MPPPIDTIVQSDAQPNMYDVRSESARPHRADPVDTVESIQAKLNREALDRFFSQAADGPFLIIARVGKYVFLAIALPTYIFMYGIPKWLLTRAAPNLMKIMGKLGKLSGKMFLMISAFGGQYLSRIYQTIARRANAVKRKIIRRLEKIIAPFIHASQAIQKGMAALFRPFNQAGQTAANKIQSATEALKNFVDRRGEMFRKIALMPANGFETATKYAQRFYQSAKQAIIPRIVEVANTVKKGVDKSADLVKKMVQLPARAIGKGSQLVNEYAVQPVITWMAAKINTANEACLRTFKQIKEAIQYQINRVVNKMQQALDIASKVAITCINVLNHAVRAPVQFINRLTASVVEKSFSRFKHLYKKAEHFVHKVAEFCSRVLLGCKRMLIKLFKKIAQKAKEFSAFAKKKYHLWKAKVKAAPKKLIHYTKQSIQFFRMLLHRLVYLLRLLIAWTIAFMRHGLRLVREIVAEHQKKQDDRISG